jgi:hypothetical protein
LDSLHSGMSVGLGFLLFCTFLAFVWFIFQNIKKRMFPKSKPVEVTDLSNFQFEEKREEKRVDIVWPASVITVDELIKAQAKELSRNGAFIKCDKPLLPGEQFILTIEPPAKGPISLNSVVVWSNSNIPEEKVVARGMGVRFIKNKNEDIKMLKSAIEEYSKYLEKTSAQQSAVI